MTEAEAIGKVRKLFALAVRAGTEAEAALAADKAQGILTEYKLTTSQITLDEAAPGTDVDETRHSFGAGTRRIQSWQVRLLGAVASTHYCKVILPRHSPNGATFTLIGRAADRQIAADTWEHLRETVQRFTLDYRPTGIAITGDEVALTGGALRTARAAFALGCAERLTERLYEAFRRRTEATTESRALVVTSTREVEAVMARLYPRLGVHRDRSAGGWRQPGHLDAGRTAGSNVGLLAGRRLATASARQLS